MLEVAIYSGGVTGEMKPPHIADTLPKDYRGREQTFIKHLILERYLKRVAFNILSFKQDFVFVDGFSGPWASQSSDCDDTSFRKAIHCLGDVRDEWKRHGRDCCVRCIFVEKGARAFARLEQAVKSTTYIEATAIHGRFEEGVQEVGHLIGNAFSLVFIDPKGWTFDLQRMKPLLCHRPGEVLINLMFDHLNRFSAYPLHSRSP